MKAKLFKNIFRGNWIKENIATFYVACIIESLSLNLDLPILEVHDCMDDRTGHICIRHKLTFIVEANNLFEC